MKYCVEFEIMYVQEIYSYMLTHSLDLVNLEISHRNIKLQKIYQTDYSRFLLLCSNFSK